MKKTDKASLF